MNTNSRKQTPEANVEGAQGLSNPQVGLEQVAKAAGAIRHFISEQQLGVMGNACRGEEGAFFRQRFLDLEKLIADMPRTYEQDGAGMEAVAYLHYFTAGFDWYITEKDMTGPGVDQAFGLAIVHERELGYISIREIAANGAELDLYFEAATLSVLVDGRTIRI
ncbi:MAG: hypothetical protein ACYDBH_13265 [Acidobacteriaceae bacterium]